MSDETNTPVRESNTPAGETSTPAREAAAPAGEKSTPTRDDGPCRDVTLLRPADFGDDHPRISLHLLVKNGEGCVPRLLENVGRYVDEIVAVVNDTTDRTVQILRDYAASRGPDFGLDVVEVTSGSHPQYYLIDEAQTYEEGRPIAGESSEQLGPFTGRPLLADWSAVRNLGWHRCTRPWILFLDADDVVADPEAIWGLCAEMERRGLEMACTRYVYDACADGSSNAEVYRERLARNLPYITWTGPVHESLTGSRKTAHVEGNLVVVDRKDNIGRDVRVPGRCLKILYHHARSRDWAVPARILMYLAMECRVSLPDLTLELVERYLETSTWPEERAWACALVGEILEGRSDYAGASAWYERSLCEYPGSKSAWRLVRSRFREEKWREVVYAYEVGVASKPVLQLLDGGTAYEDRSKILVAAAWEKLGEYSRALQMCEEALLSFPENSNLLLLRDQLQKMARRCAT